MSNDTGHRDTKILSPPGEDKCISPLFLYRVLRIVSHEDTRNKQPQTNTALVSCRCRRLALSLSFLPYQLLYSLGTLRQTLRDFARHVLFLCCWSPASLICSGSSLTRAPRDGDTNSDWHLELRQQKCHHWFGVFSWITSTQPLVWPAPFCLQGICQPH